MEYLHCLNPGTDVLISFECKGETLTLSATVIDVVDGSVGVRFPEREIQVKDIPKNTRIKLEFRAEAKAIGWEIEEWRIKDKDKIPYLTLRSSDKAHNLNEREAYRVSLTTVQPVQTASRESFNVLTKDVSQTGIGFFTNRILKKDDIITITFSKTEMSFQAQFKIVRKITGREDNFFYGAELLGGINPKLNKLVQQKQIDELRRRKDRIS